jgi:iron complex outermembrane recepter protein
MKSRIGATVSLLAFSTVAAPVYAQDSSQDKSKSAMNDAIIVTARRVNEKLQDVPVAVTVVQGGALTQLGVTTAVDLRTVVPSLNVTNAAGRPTTPLYSMRGQRGSDVHITQDAPIAAYLDEVLITPNSGSAGSLFDLENVQVVKGPQGTLFGRNTTGGAVLYTSAKPTNELGAGMEVGYANYDSWKANGFINAPISDAIRVRAAVSYTKQGGFGTVRAGPDIGSDVQGYKQIAGRVSIAIKPSDGFENLTIVGYSKLEDEGGSAFRILDTPLPGDPSGFFRYGLADIFLNQFAGGALTAAIARQRAGGRYDIESSERVGGESKVWSVSNATTIKLSDTLILKNILGYRELDAWDSLDFDGTILSILGASNAVRAKTYSEELQLQGKGLNDRLDFIFGLYFFDQRGAEGTGLPFVDVRNQPSGNVVLGGAFDPGNNTLQFVRVVNQSFSGFGQIGYKLTDSLTFNAGLRYTVDRRSSDSTDGAVSSTLSDNNHPLVTRCNYTTVNAGGATVPLPATYQDCRVKASVSFAEPSWLVGLDWKVDPDTLAYIASRHSYRSGGFQSRPTSNDEAVKSFAPEKVTDVEIGLKRDWRLSTDVRLRTNIAAYYQWYSDIQRSSTTLVRGTPSNTVGNAATAHIKGLELESELRIGSIVKFAFNYAFTDAKFGKFLSPQIAAGLPVIQDRSAYPFTYVPKHQINGSVTLTPDIGGAGDLSLTTNIYYVTRQFFGDDYNSAADLAFLTGAPLSAIPADTFYSQPSYALVNARAQLDNIGGTGLRAGVWVKNLFDKRYVDSGVPFQNSLGAGVGIYGNPRTIGIDLGYKF